MVGEPFPHVVQEEIAVREDGLRGQLGEERIDAGHVARDMAARAPGLAAEAFAGEDLGIFEVAAAGDRERLAVVDDVVELLVVDLGEPPLDLGHAIGLRRRAVLRREHRRGDADVAEERRGRLLLDGRLRGLPAEAAKDEGLLAQIVDLVGAARDAVTVGVVGVGERAEVGLRDRLEEAEPRTAGARVARS